MMSFSRRGRAAVASSFAVVAAATLAPAAGAAAISYQESVSPTASYQMGATFVRDDQDNNKDFESVAIFGTTTTATLRSLYSYGLSDIPAGSTITGVSFTLTVNNQDNSASVTTAQSFSLARLTGTFDETSVKFTTSPGLGETLSTTTVIPDGGTGVVGGSKVTFGTSPEFVAAAQAALDANRPLDFAAIRTGESTATRAVLFVVGDDPSNSGVNVASNAPLLTVDYTPVPEPTAVGALGAVAIGLLARRRRARS